MITTATNLLSHRRWWLALALLVCLTPARAAVAQEERHQLTDHEFSQLREVLKMLENGKGALNELGRAELAVLLGVVAHEVRGQLDRAGGLREERPARDEERSERQIVEERLEVLRAALGIVREAMHLEVAERIEHAIHAHELMLEGRRGEKARKVIRTAPKAEETIELLGHAAHLYQEFGMPDRAEMILHMRKELWRSRERRGEREGDEREYAPDRERPRHLSQHDFEAAANRIEVMRMALKAILEAGREEAAETLKQAIHAYEVTLEGREDRKALNIRERAPKLGQQVEILMYAAKLWEEFGNVDKAEVIAQTAEHLREHLEGRAHLGDEEGEEHRDRDRKTDRKRAARLHEEDREALIGRIEELEERIAQLERMLRLRNERR